MRGPARWTGVPLAVASLLAGAVAAALPVGDFEAEDLQGRIVDSRRLRGKVVLLGLATDETSDEVVDWQVRLGYEAGVVLGGGDRVEVVSIADVSEYLWIARPFVRGRLSGIDRQARERLLARFAEEETEPPPDLDDRVHLVPDWSGRIARGLAPESERHLPHMFVLDADGEIRGHFTENSEAARGAAVAIVQSLLSP